MGSRGLCYTGCQRVRDRGCSRLPGGVHARATPVSCMQGYWRTCVGHLVARPDHNRSARSMGRPKAPQPWARRGRSALALLLLRDIGAVIEHKECTSGCLGRSWGIPVCRRDISPMCLASYFCRVWRLVCAWRPESVPFPPWHRPGRKVLGIPGHLYSQNAGPHASLGTVAESRTADGPSQRCAIG